MRYHNIILFSAIALIASACANNESKHNFTNQVFISAEKLNEEVRVQADEHVSTMTREITVSMASPEAKDITVKYECNASLLDHYRQAYYDPETELLPAENYDLSELESVIKAGKVTSAPATVKFVNLEKLDYSKQYVLPLSIASSGDMPVLASASTLYYIVKEASLVNVAADMYKNRAWPVWKDNTPFKDMTEFTMEAMVLVHAFDNASSILTVMGIEDRFLMRIGDVTIPTNQVQIAYAVKDEEDKTTRGHVSNSGMQLKADRWYHLCVTFNNGIIKFYLDGKLKGEGDASSMGRSSVDFSTEHSEEDDGKPRCFWIGYSYDHDRSLNGMICEARMWNKALTAEEINSQNHFYKIDPATPGLIAYWKFADGRGKTVKDYSSFGNDMESQDPISWISVSLPLK